MKKNVVFMACVVNKDRVKKYGNFDYFHYSIKTWEYWCERNDCLFVPFTEPVEEDLFRYRINWQKAIFLFDELEKRGIEYDQIALVDSSFMIRHDTPNFFEMTDRRFTAWRDMDNMRWIYYSIEGYKDIFDGFELDQSKYVNSSPMIFNKSHKEVFQSFKKLYYDNVDTFVELQDKIVRRGTEQTPLNYWLQINNVDIKTDLSLSYKLTHIHRKQMFNHNWQLNEDMTPFFVKYGYVWVFSGFDKRQRDNLMKEAWKLVKHRYNKDFFIRNSGVIESKDINKQCTTLKFKKDIYNTFNKPHFKNMTLLELGCNQGNTTRVYAECFGKVIAVDMTEDNIKIAKKKCEEVDNVEFITADVYDLNFKLPKADVVHVDAGHTYQHLAYDIDRCIDLLDDPIFIIDDYGNPRQQIKKAVNDKVEQHQLKINKFIGEKDGFICTHGLVFDDREGVIINLK